MVNNGDSNSSSRCLPDAISLYLTRYLANKPVLAREREARYYLEKLPEERRERKEKRDERIQIHWKTQEMTRNIVKYRVFYECDLQKLAFYSGGVTINRQILLIWHLNRPQIDTQRPPRRGPKKHHKKNTFSHPFRSPGWPQNGHQNHNKPLRDSFF